MFPIQSLHHLSFRVPDVDAAKAFYCDLLGFAEIERPNLGLPGAWLRGHGVEVHLLGVPREAGEAAGGELNPTRGCGPKFRAPSEPSFIRVALPRGARRQRCQH